MGNGRLRDRAAVGGGFAEAVALEERVSFAGTRAGGVYQRAAVGRVEGVERVMDGVWRVDYREVR